MNDLQIIQENAALLEAALKQPHYKRLGHEAIALIIAKCRDIGISPLKGLNGGMCSINGKIEMTSNLMHMMIREKKHSITVDKKSDNNICILHGKRADNGDTCMVTFSIEDAKAAGLIRPNTPWTKYPSDMLFARALSRLARRLFPDVVQGCYVEGELKDSLTIKNEDIKPITPIEINQEENRLINEEEKKNLVEKLHNKDKHRELFNKWLENRGETLDDITLTVYNRILTSIESDVDEQEE